jgi:hypothetical protein
MKGVFPGHSLDRAVGPLALALMAAGVTGALFIPDRATSSDALIHATEISHSPNQRIPRRASRVPVSLISERSPAWGVRSSSSPSKKPRSTAAAANLIHDLAVLGWIGGLRQQRWYIQVSRRSLRI